jgi:hypothetical protein
VSDDDELEQCLAETEERIRLTQVLLHESAANAQKAEKLIATALDQIQRSRNRVLPCPLPYGVRNPP